jgi:hypothetical protein
MPDKYDERARKWLGEELSTGPGMAMPWRADERLAHLLRSVAEEEREACAAIPHEWAVSSSSHTCHENDPCCHVRLGKEIETRIRSRSTSEPTT